MSKKTIKELAEEIGVSKTAISKKVTEKQKKTWFAKIGNQFVISEEGQEAIKSLFETTKKNQAQTSWRKDENQVSDSDFYQKQLLVKDNQIDMLQNLLKEQQNLLNQQQRLTLQTNKQIEKLQLQLTDYTNDSANQEEHTYSTVTEKHKEPIKKSFFNRFFNK
jgi:predicted transcriptional regulator